MRRKEQEITDRGEIDALIKASTVCRLGLSDDGKPYVVPMCFGYDGKNLYLHSAKSGMKIDILKKNDRVCFEFDSYGRLEESDKACDWGIEYKSVIGFGKASFVEDEDDKKKALDTIMSQYTGRNFEFPPQMLKAVAVIKVDIESITGKRSS
jgi:nitroimidazol reductase NimA-like FMN-containing flavoprotein (pyridoxamine 5'-phosphate oxidase superfamily)